MGMVYIPIYICGDTMTGIYIWGFFVDVMVREVRRRTEISFTSKVQLFANIVKYHQKLHLK